MGIIAGILIAVAIIAAIIGVFLKVKGGRIAKTPFVPTGQAVGSSEPKISVQGNVQCPQPLTSPVSGTPCLYYHLKVEGFWKKAEGKDGSKTYAEEKVAAPFQIDDGSGGIPVDASKGGDMGMVKSFDETKKEGFFADLKGAVGKGEPMMFGNYAFANPPMSKANRFKCVERIVPIPPQAFVLGKLEQGVITSGGMLGLIFSPKTREDLMGSSAKNAKMAFIAAAACGGIGLVAGAISAVM